MTRNGFLLALAAAALLGTTAAEAQISSAQQSALRANCRSDFMSHCSGVTPGGKDALMCLQKNVESLSSACQAAVRATLPPPAAAKAEPAPQTITAAPPAPPTSPVAAAPAPAVAAAPPPPAAPAPAAVAAPAAAAPPPRKAVVAPPSAPRPVTVATAAPTPAQQSAMRASCRNDFMARCAGVQPGGKDALICLQRHVAVLSPSCKSVVAATMGAPGATPAVAAAPAAVMPAGGPPPEKLKALKFTCRSDFRRLCRNVPEGPQAFACLQGNIAKLSPNCRTSVQDIAESMPAGGAMPPATAVAVKPAPVPHNPKAPMVDAAIVLRACKLDVIRHCRGAGLGGGQMLACLTAHEADLTFRCRTAMKVSSPLH